HSEAINDILRSREAYRLHNGAMSNFPRRMEMYDKEAIDILRRLELLILEYRQPQVGATSI
ncbi:MAG TPA: hypothetical protein VFW42_00260, partial [Fluviicoccus sp.]|nr:hypothetical protein [Fluviicoccus sp.]